MLKLFERGIGLVSTIVLARLLLPEDFGLVAMAVAVVALLELMAAFGFDAALIQRQNTARAHYDTAWTFNVLFGSTIALLLLLLATPAATFYREPRLTLLLPVLAISALVGGFENIGTVAFRKELDFRSEFRFLLFKRLATFFVTLSLAIALRSYWALVAGIVVGRSVSVYVSYRLHPYRPRFSLAARGDLFRFSKWLLISSLIQFLHNRSTDFILGRTVGSHGLGVYNVAVEIATLPSTEVIAPVNRAVFPAYSRLAGDLEQLRLRFLDVFSTICIVAFPVSVGVFCVADPAVNLLLGSRWSDAIPIVQIVAISGLASALQSNFYLVIVALGRPRANTIFSALLLAVSLPLIVLASLRYGAVGAAFAHCLASVGGLLGIRFVLSRFTGLSVATLVLAAFRPGVASLAMAGVVISTQGLLIRQFEASALLQLVVLPAVGAAVYAFLLWVLWAVSGRTDSVERRIVTLIGRELTTLKRATNSRGTLK